MPGSIPGIFTFAAGIPISAPSVAGLQSSRELPIMSRPSALRSTVVCMLISFLPAISAQAKADIDQNLKNQYRGKTLILRGFYSGRSLHFDSSGNLREAPVSGDWTTDGVVQVNDISVSGDHLTIHASRLHWGWLRGEGMTTLHDQAANDKQDRDDKKDRNLQIEADLGGERRPKRPTPHSPASSSRLKTISQTSCQSTGAAAFEPR